MADGVRWSVYDREGNRIYLTEERWEHITQPSNHPEMSDYEAELMSTLQQGRRQQDTINPQKYSYTKAFDNLTDDNTHIVALVLFRYREQIGSRPVANNYVVTAYQKEIG